MQAKVIHLIKRLEQIDREIAELHHLVAGIDGSRSYRNTMKIAAEKQINDLVGERVKLMDLKIENPPDFLTKHVGTPEVKKSEQPRIALEALIGSSTSTLVSARREPQIAEAPTREANPLDKFTRMMTVDEMLPVSKSAIEPRTRAATKPAGKSRAEILRDLPTIQY